MTALEHFNTWFKKFWGSTPPSLDNGSILTIALAQPWVDRGIIANIKIPSARAQNLADGMTDFKQPGLVGLTFAEYWLGSLMDTAGIDPDMEWLISLNRKVLARDWDGALALVKSRPSSGSSTPTVDTSALKSSLGQIQSAVTNMGKLLQ